MSTRPKTYLNWSSGKDASMALHQLLKIGQHDISRLVTTVNGHYERVSMHGLRISLLERQAKAIGIPLQMIRLPENPSMKEYGEIMNHNLRQLKQEGYEVSAFGDIFLEDLRIYREQQLNEAGLTSCFPLWKQDTTELIHSFIGEGFRAIIICLDSRKLDRSFLGREIDESFLKDLPKDVDPCGENGEFHTFCFDGPVFKQPVMFEKGEATFREYDIREDQDGEVVTSKAGYWFLDVS